MTNIIDKVKVLGAVFIVVAGVAAFYTLDGSSQLLRVGLLIVSIIAAVGVALLSTPGQDAWEFAKGARGEIRKIVWPTRRDTVQSTIDRDRYGDSDWTVSVAAGHNFILVDL